MSRRRGRQVSTTVVSTCLSSHEHRQGTTLFVVIIFGLPLMPPAPAGPPKDLNDGLLHGQDQAPEQPPNLWYAQRQARPCWALKAARPLRFWTGGGLFFNASTAMGPARKTTKSA